MVECLFLLASRCFGLLTERFQSSQSDTQQRNWAELPPELLRAIAECLPIPDNFHFRAVCTSWAYASKDFLRIAPNFPWLMKTGGKGVLSFFSYMDSRYFRLPIAYKINHHYCVGSRDGWLVMSDLFKSKVTYILNPLTGAEINLPSLSTSFISKVILSANPSVDADFIVVLIYGNYCECLAFARAGDETWTQVHTHSTGIGHVDDVIFHKGKMLTISPFGKFQIFDLMGPSLEASTFVKINWGEDRFQDGISLVTSPSGDLFLILTYYFRIMKFDTTVESSWIEIKDLGDLSLFMDKHKCMLLSAKDIPGLKRNCIYYSRQDPSTLFKERIDEVKVFDLAKGISEECFVTKLRSKSSIRFPPVWFTPSLCL